MEMVLHVLIVVFGCLLGAHMLTKWLYATLVFIGKSESNTRFVLEVTCGVVEILGIVLCAYKFLIG